jgi:hypothetical protein
MVPNTTRLEREGKKLAPEKSRSAEAGRCRPSVLIITESGPPHQDFFFLTLALLQENTTCQVKVEMPVGRHIRQFQGIARFAAYSLCRPFHTVLRTYLGKTSGVGRRTLIHAE